MTEIGFELLFERQIRKLREAGLPPQVIFSLENQKRRVMDLLHSRIEHLKGTIPFLPVITTRVKTFYDLAAMIQYNRHRGFISLNTGEKIIPSFSKTKKTFWTNQPSSESWSGSYYVFNVNVKETVHIKDNGEYGNFLKPVEKRVSDTRRRLTVEEAVMLCFMCPDILTPNRDILTKSKTRKSEWRPSSNIAISTTFIEEKRKRKLVPEITSMPQHRECKLTIPSCDLYTT